MSELTLLATQLRDANLRIEVLTLHRDMLVSNLATAVLFLRPQWPTLATVMTDAMDSLQKQHEELNSLCVETSHV